jgi:hypothetical protein
MAWFLVLWRRRGMPSRVVHYSASGDSVHSVDQAGRNHRLADEAVREWKHSSECSVRRQ